MRQTLMAVVVALMAVACKTQDATGSGVKDITVNETSCSCSAQWTCGPNGQPRGRVTSTQSFQREQDCQSDLISQVSSSGICPQNDYTLVTGSYVPQCANIELTMLTCSSGQGKGTCDAINNLISLMSINCSGNCTPYIQREMWALDAIYQWALLTQNAAYRVSPQVAQLASRAQLQLCRRQYSDLDDTWLQYVKAHANAGIQNLGGIARAGGAPADQCTGFR